MLADGVEAACRSLEDPSPAKIRTVIKTITDDCLRDGQLDATDLTLGDLNRVSESFQRVLAHIHHRRLDYPGFDFNRRQDKGSPGSAGVWRRRSRSLPRRCPSRERWPPSDRDGRPPHPLELDLANPCRYPEVACAGCGHGCGRLVGELAPQVDEPRRAVHQRPPHAHAQPRLSRQGQEHRRALVPGRGDGRGAAPRRHRDRRADRPPAGRRRSGTTWSASCEVLLLHGVLHCLGYDHETDDGTMARLERRLRRRLVTAPGIERRTPHHAEGGEARP